MKEGANCVPPPVILCWLYGCPEQHEMDWVKTGRECSRMHVRVPEGNARGPPSSLMSTCKGMASL